MYYRTKTIKGNEYWYLQETYRVGNQVKTRHLRYIGKAKPSIAPGVYSRQLRQKEAAQKPPKIKLDDTAFYVEERFSHAEVRSMFKEEATKVWGNKEATDRIELAVIYQDQKAPMMLGSSDKAAVADILTRPPKNAVLYIDKNLKFENKSQFRAYLKHESIHLGHKRHNADFRYVAKKHDVPLTVTHYKTKAFHLQVKIGHRYKTIESFDTLEEANRVGYKMVEETKIKDPEELKKLKLRVVY